MKRLEEIIDECQKIIDELHPIINKIQSIVDEAYAPNTGDGREIALGIKRAKEKMDENLRRNLFKTHTNNDDPYENLDAPLMSIPHNIKYLVLEIFLERRDGPKNTLTAKGE